MAAVTNATTITTNTNLIDSEFISKSLNLAVQTPKIYRQIAKPVMLGPGESRVYTHVLRSHLAAAAAVTETDEVGATALADSQIQVTVALVASAVMLSDQAKGSSVLMPNGQTADAIGRAADAVTLYLDDAFHGESANMTNTMGSNAATHDMLNWNTMLATYSAQAKNVDNVAFVGHPDAARDLGEDIFTSAAAILSNDTAGQLFGQAAGGFRQGLRFMIGNVPVFSTDEIPVADTTGWGNYLTSVGDDGAVALVSKVGLEATSWREPKRFGDWLIAWTDAAVGVIDQARCLEVITKT